jgi:nicotinate-nucleotide--dimethylbenzimidazole phosphoribosyltransferase
VTGQMVNNFLEGGAAINVLCRHHQIDIGIVDMGVCADFDDHPDLVKKKIGMGTRNFAVEAAMTAAEAQRAVEAGMEAFLAEHAVQRIDMVGLGEMGIGNTTAASAIISAVTGMTPAQATGRGTGIDDKGVEHKAEIIEKALRFHDPDPLDGFEILRKVGGFEIAGIVGAILAAASKKSAVVLDGVISTAAGLVAYLIHPDIQGYLISGHKSTEPAHEAALSYLKLEPVIDLHMRLGEGTGAALTISVAETAARIMREMASFEQAGVSNRPEAL